MPHHQHCSLNALRIEVFLQVTDLGSSFVFSVNHLGVLLFESGILGHLLLNDRNHARECVHDISLLNLGFPEVLRLVPFVLVSVAALWFALPAVGFALLPAVGFALSVLFDYVSRSSMYFSRSPLALVASFSLFTTGSLGVVPSLFLSRVLW